MCSKLDTSNINVTYTHLKKNKYKTSSIPMIIKYYVANQIMTEHYMTFKTI